MGIFYPRGCTWKYRSTRSTVIRSRVTQSGGGTQLTIALYHPFIMCRDSLWRRSMLPVTALSNLPLPPSSAPHLLFPLRLALIAWTRRCMRVWFCDRPGSAENLSSTSLHMSAEIHTLFLDSHVFGFWMYLRRAAKSLSSLVGVDGGRRGIHIRHRRYLVCHLRGYLQRHPRTV